MVVDVRVDNDTAESQNAPELELWCGEDQQAFLGGTYQWQEMGGATFLEGTREFTYPETCASPELRAAPVVHDGEFVRWDARPPG